MKNVLITGASRGIGFATAKKFLKEGYVVICASRNLDPLYKLQEEYPATCIIRMLDIQNESSIKEFVEQISVYQLDIIIHNAGGIVNKPFQEISKSDLYLCYEVNVLGPFLLTQRLLPLLKSDAHSVFISSMGGFQGSQKFPGLTAYSSSKASIVSLTECLQEEFKETDLTFNCLCLGAVQTEMLENAFPGYEAPLKSEQIATYIFNFTTQDATFIRGKIIPVSRSTP